MNVVPLSRNSLNDLLVESDPAFYCRNFGEKTVIKPPASPQPVSCLVKS